MSERNDQHYFVICAEMNDKGEVVFTIDDDTASARFSEGVVWGKNDTWLNMDTTVTIRANDQMMRELLAKKLGLL